MKRVHLATGTGILVLLGATLLGQAQQAASAATDAVVPTMVRFGGVLTDENGKPLTGAVGVTFLLYKEQQGGPPLWMETQNVQPDKAGHYSVMLGATSSTGLPTDLFVQGEARWLGAQAQGQEEQPRVMLLSVPYALKAGDAATLGGLPASAFVLAAPNSYAAAAPMMTDGEALAAPSSASPLATSDVTTTGGTANTFPLFTTATNIQNSILTQTGTTAINVGGKLNLPALGTATSAAGFNSRPLDFVASAYNGTAAVAQTFQWQAEALNNDKTTATGTLSLLYASGTATPEETGLKISSKGLFTFASGQTFPGTGTITGITTAAGSGLKGGGTTGTLSLSIPAAGVTNAMLANPSLTVTAGSDLTGGGSVALGGSTTLNLDTTKVPLLAAANTFTGNQTVDGNLSATGVVTGSEFQIGSNLFAFGTYATDNAFLGFAGNSTTTGVYDTAIGESALAANSTGNSNTAVGEGAMLANTSGNGNTAAGILALSANTGDANGDGSDNTAIGNQSLLNNTTGNGNTGLGFFALRFNTTGNFNTALGYEAYMGADNLTNATAIGANAEVTESNALVLGSINGVNGATSNTNVGIGTTSPAYTLDVHGTGNFTGLVNFASGQTFPGTGTITGVSASTGLSGGGTSGTVTLTNIGILGVTAGTGISSSGGQTPTISNTGILALTSGTGVSISSGQSPTISVNTTQVPLLSSGNLSLSSSSSYQIGGIPFAFGSSANNNAFLGFAGSTGSTGAGNTGVGYDAVLHGSGSNNTGVGLNALFNTNSGSANTAVGSNAGGSNTTGSYNTLIGYYAGTDGTACKGPCSFLTNATAIGAYADVAADNALVLGSIMGTNGCLAANGCVNANVGIGTAAPQATLDVMGGLIHVGGTPAPNPSVQGAYLGWNETNGVGETDFFNNEGGGTGGWYFINTNSSGTPLNGPYVASISGNGVVWANGGFNGFCLNGTAVFDTTDGDNCNMDLAETYPSTQSTEPGDLVSLVPGSEASVRKSAKRYDSLLLGVVSTNPGLVFDNGRTRLAGDNSVAPSKDKAVIALAGRVPVKVSMENGPIRVGDALTSSLRAGVAMKATAAGKIIGYALAPATKNGKVLMFVQAGYYAAPALATLQSNFAKLRHENVQGRQEILRLQKENASLRSQFAEVLAQVKQIRAELHDRETHTAQVVYPTKH